MFFLRINKTTPAKAGVVFKTLDLQLVHSVYSKSFKHSIGLFNYKFIIKQKRPIKVVLKLYFYVLNILCF